MTSKAYGTIERNFARVNDLAGKPRALVRVTVSVALGRQQFMPVFPAFLEQHIGAY